MCMYSAEFRLAQNFWSGMLLIIKRFSVEIKTGVLLHSNTQKLCSFASFEHSAAVQSWDVRNKGATTFGWAKEGIELRD